LVIEAYFSLASAQYDVKNLEDFFKLSRERVAEIKARSKIGRSRRGELIEAEAQLHTADSQLKNGLIELEAAKKNFTFLTLKESEFITLGDLPELKDTLVAFQSKLNSRPDVLASKQQVQMAHTQVEVSKGGHYPSLDLISNYYLERTGILASSKWDAALVYTVPLYQGGGVSSQVREAVEAKRAAELTNNEYIRTAERDLAIQYQNYLQILEQYKSLKQARDKAEEAYRLSLKDYDLGLITNLDVLQSLNFYVTTERNYDGLFVLGHLAYHNLEAAAGVLP
jgi:outer membrane protein